MYGTVELLIGASLANLVGTTAARGADGAATESLVSIMQGLAVTISPPPDFSSALFLTIVDVAIL